METKKYTNHSFFWLNIANLFLWVFILSINLPRKPFDTSDILVLSLVLLILVTYLILVIISGLGWHSYLEISEEGVKMKGCAKRISDNKKETLDDIFIPWGDVEEINGSIGGPVLVVKTGEKIKLTQQIEIDGKTLRKAFEHHKSKQQEEFKQLKDDSDQLEITSVISAIDNDTKPLWTASPEVFKIPRK